MHVYMFLSVVKCLQHGNRARFHLINIMPVLILSIMVWYQVSVFFSISGAGGMWSYWSNQTASGDMGLGWVIQAGSGGWSHVFFSD